MNPFCPKTPYNQLPLLPPTADLESPNLLKACTKAHKALAYLNMATKLIPNQTVLIQGIPLLESQASSEIENIVTTTDELFEYSQNPGLSVNPATKEALQYREALYQGYQSLEKHPLSIPVICNICSTIRQIDTNIRKLPGTALVNDSSGKKIYTPPEGEERLRALLDNWLDYIHKKDDQTDPLIKLAVQHYQFEAIHPFSDGNGRTGRIINLLYLTQEKLLDTPLLYLSRYIIKNKNTYYSKILDVTTKSSWHEWILYFLEAIKETSIWTLHKILAIKTLIEDSSILLKEKLPTVYSEGLIELLFTQPYLRIQNLVEKESIDEDTAAKLLRELCTIGFLESVKKEREQLFINQQFLALLRKN